MKYTLLKPMQWKPRPPRTMTIAEIPHEKLYAVDIETTGLDPLTDSIVGIAIAGDFGNCYIDTRDPQLLTEALTFLADKEWIAFNSVFDGSFIVAAQQRLLGREYLDYTKAIVGDTMVAFKMFANEGEPGQRHNLGIAIEDLLGWEGNQKDTLDQLLEKHGLKKNEMGQLADLEPEAFALYGAMDAEACWQLHWYFESYFEVWPAAREAYENYKVLVQLVIEQKLRGVQIDVDRMRVLQTELEQNMRTLEQEFRAHPDVAPFLVDYESEARVEEIVVETPRIIRAKKSDEPWNDGLTWTPSDKPAKAKWEEEHGVWERTEIVKKIKVKKHQEVRFNVQSKAHLRKLFYDHLGYEPIEKTETGLGKIDKKILPKLGEPGALLAKYNKHLKLLGYVNKVLERVDEHGILRFDLAVHGTVTGRSAGRGGINVQQLSKDERFQSCFLHRPGHSLIDTDFTSLENVVLAEASRDKGLLELYASGKPHDSYLFVACFVFPDSGIAEVYQPDNPTVESVASAKKQFKKYRDICKVLVLSSNYGAGAPKIHATLTQSGVDISLEEVKHIREKYWELFAGIKAFETKLTREWERNDGYILNGLGRPICVTKDYLKDINNKYCQSTGVGLLHTLLKIIDRKRRERNVEMYPWIVDFHDQTSWEISREWEEQAKAIFKEAYAELNAYLDPLIPLKGDVDIGECLWEFKAG